MPLTKKNFTSIENILLETLAPGFFLSKKNSQFTKNSRHYTRRAFHQKYFFANKSCRTKEDVLLANTHGARSCTKIFSQQRKFQFERKCFVSKHARSKSRTSSRPSAVTAFASILPLTLQNALTARRSTPGQALLQERGVHQRLFCQQRKILRVQPLEAG